MSELPPGFVLDGAGPAQPPPMVPPEASPAPAGLPSGFVLDGQQPPAQEQAPHKFGLADTWPARMAKAIYSGVTLPRDVITGQAQMWDPNTGHTNTDVINRSAELAAVATPVSPATRAGAGFMGVPKSPPPPTVEMLKDAAKGAYQSPEVTAVEIKSATMPKLSEQIVTDLNAAGFDESLAPKTFSLLGKMTKAPEEESFVTVSNLDTLRKMFGKAAGSPDATERAAASAAKKAVDDFLTKLPERDVLAGDAGRASNILNEARGNYSAAKRAENFDSKIVAAENRASAANSGMNVANSIRQRVADILNSESARRGYNADEIAAMQKVVDGTATQNTLRGLGNLLGGGGGLGAITSAAVGGYATGGPGAVAPVIGFGLKHLANVLTERQAARVSELIRSRAPLAKGASNSLESWSKYADAFSRAPSARSMAMFNLASRNLANNLQTIGVSVSPNDLVRSIGGARPGVADQQDNRP